MRRVSSRPDREGSPSNERRRLGRFVVIGACALSLVLARAASWTGVPQVWVSLLAALGFGAAAILPLHYFRPKTPIAVQVALGLLVAALIFGAWWYLAG